MILADDVDELDIGAFRIQRVMLHLGAARFEVDRLSVVSGYDFDGSWIHVGVAVVAVALLDGKAVAVIVIAGGIARASVFLPAGALVSAVIIVERGWIVGRSTTGGLTHVA